MPFDTEELLRLNLQHGGGGFRGNWQGMLTERLRVINAIPDPFERVAYLAMVLIADQPFRNANHRTSASATINELTGRTNRTEHEIENWLRTAHERDEQGLGMDIQMLQESDTSPLVVQARRAFIEYLGG